MEATFSHEWEGRRFELPFRTGDDFQRELIEVGLRVSFALAQGNESSEGGRPFILADRFAQAVRS